MNLNAINWHQEHYDRGVAKNMATKRRTTPSRPHWSRSAA